MSATKYTGRWLARGRTGSRSSAEVVLPLVFGLVHPRRVVDLGCGTGVWLAVAAELGAEVLGVDGGYVRDSLEIPAGCFVEHDLREPLRLPGRYDLAVSLEVGEHLPESAARTFVGSLAAAAPVVLFSAAVPFQGGTGHVNERWQDWWAGLFAEVGYRPVDCVRPRVWSDPRVRFYYAQNTLLYVEQDSPIDGEAGLPLRVVHPALYDDTVRRFPPRGMVDRRRLARFALRR